MARARRYPWEFHGEVLTVETPEQVRLELRIAPFGARLAAALLDRLLIALMLIGLLMVVAFVGLAAGAGLGAGIGDWIGLIAVLSWFVISIGYFVVEELRGEGRTFGKRRLGLRTVSLTGRGLSPAQSVVRNLARIADELPPFWIVPAITPGSRRIGDLLAGTAVILERAPKPTAARRTRFLDALAPSWREIPDRRFGFTRHHAERLRSDDLNLVEYLDERLRGMPPGRRRAALAALAAKYVARLEDDSLAEAAADDPERFMQELGLFLRDRFDDQRG